jgi:hypothetical protein
MAEENIQEHKSTFWVKPFLKYGFERKRYWPSWEGSKNSDEYKPIVKTEQK